MIGTRRTCALVVGMLVVGMACGSDAGSESNTAVSAPVIEAPPTPQDFEAALLEGGLTFEEYEEAFFAFVGCIDEEGWSLVGEPTLTSRLSYDYDLVSSVRETAGPEARDQALAGLERCRTEYFDAVQRQWAIQTAMTETEAQEARDHLGACMRAVGYDLPEHPAQDDWNDYIRVIEGSDPAPREAFRACLPLTQKEFGLRSSEVP